MYVVKNAKTHRSERFTDLDAATVYATEQIAVSRQVNLGTRVDTYAVYDETTSTVAAVARV